MAERSRAGGGLLAVAEVVLALIGVYSLTVLLVFPLLPVTRTLEFALQAGSDTEAQPADYVVSELEAREVASAVLLGEDDPSRLVLEGVRDAERAERAVSEILEGAGYQSADAEETKVEADRENIFSAGGRLPAMLAIQSAVFLIAGWMLFLWRTGAPDPARVTHPVAALVGVAGGVVTLVLSGLVGFVLDRLGLPVQEQVWVEDLLSRRDTLARVAPWMVLVGPVAEEVFFRGYAFRLLTSRAGVAVGYVVSSLLFAVVHLNPSGLPVYVVIGLMFCWLYRRTGSLWAPVVAHMTLNGLVLLIAVTAPAS